MFGISYLRLGMYAVLAGVIIYLGYQYKTGQEAKAQVVVVTKQRDDAIAGHDAYVKQRAAQDVVTKTVSKDYENAVTDLVGQLNAARDHHPDIRMCHNTVPASSSASTATSKPDEASKGGSITATEQVTGPNISDGLYEIAGEAAECGERLNHLQDWVTQQLAVSTTR